MQRSKEPETFCCNFIAFLKTTLTFEHFETKKEPPGLNISKLSTTKDLVT